jgi:ABC-2 type transport system ATP-binding protein
MENVMVSVTNLSKNYGATLAVNRLSFEIFRGEFFGLLGPNGAGKTTTIGMLTGLIDPSEGRITIDGLDLLSKPKDAKAKLGFVPQDLAFYPTLSARDNLIFFGRIYGLHGKRLRKRTDDVLHLVELHDCADQAVSTFSNGMKRRLNIAIGLLHEPQILILDEPTVGVDAHLRQVILENLKDLNSGGLTVLYTTHRMDEAERLCHRVAIMDMGQMIAVDTPEVLIGKSGEGMIRVTFSEPISQPQIDQMVQFGPLTVLSVHKAHIHLKRNNTDREIKDVLALTEKAKLRIKSLDILEPSLETVFLHLTGRSLKK